MEPTREEKIKFLREQAAKSVGAISAPAADSAAPTREQKIEFLRSRQSVEPAMDVSSEAADLSGRFAVKNFGGDLSTQVEYLKSRNPNMEIQISPDKEIIAKGKNDTQWKKLDASGWTQYFTDPGELISDATDLAYDVGSGALQSAATAAGGIAGAAGTFGLGAPSGAALAGGASGAGLEALRQGIGNVLGTASGTDGLNIGLAGATGAVMPKIFGSGATPKQLDKALSGESILGADYAKKVLNSSKQDFVEAGKALTPDQEFLAKHLATVGQESGTPFKKALSIFSNAAPAETLVNANKIAPTTLIDDIGIKIDKSKPHTYLDLVEPMIQQGQYNFGENTANKFSQAVREKGAEIGRSIDKGISEIGENMPISDFKLGIESRIESLRAQNNANPQEYLKEQIKEYSDILNKFFNPSNPKAKLIKTPVKSNVFNMNGEKLSPIEQIERAGREYDYSITPQTAKNLRDILSDMAESGISPIARDKKDTMSKAVMGEMGQVSSQIGDWIYDRLKGTPRQDYKQNRDFMRTLFTKFKNPETAVKTLSNLDNPSNRVMKEYVSRFDDQYKTHFVDSAKLADLVKTFGNASITPVSSGAKTSTQKFLQGSGIGGTAGYVAGLLTGIPGAATAGGFLGGSIGGIASSPAAVAGTLKAQNALGNITGLNKLPSNVSATTQAGINSTWNMMRNKQ